MYEWVISDDNWEIPRGGFAKKAGRLATLAKIAILVVYSWHYKPEPRPLCATLALCRQVCQASTGSFAFTLNAPGEGDVSLNLAAIATGTMAALPS